MDYNERIQGLIESVKTLQYQDNGHLDKILKEAKLIIRKAFGENSDYLHELGEIRFLPIVNRSDMDMAKIARDSWQSDQTQLLNLLDVMLEDLSISADQQPDKIMQNPNGMNSGRIFVVHGRDEGMKQSVARTLEKLGLEPVILHEQANVGKTIIEKFEGNTDVGFAIVLLSPDDMAYMKTDSRKNIRPRARQNVIFEMGFFIGRLGRNRVFLLRMGDIELPSDYSGVVYTPYDDGGWRLELVRELQNAGYGVSADQLL